MSDYKTVVLELNQTTFVNHFKSIRPNVFSTTALEALYNYLDNYAKENGEDFRLDVIALCCEFCEYTSLEEFASDYGDDRYNFESWQDVTYYTTVIELDNGGALVGSF